MHQSKQQYSGHHPQYDHQHHQPDFIDDHRHISPLSSGSRGGNLECDFVEHAFHKVGQVQQKYSQDYPHHQPAIRTSSRQSPAYYSQQSQQNQIPLPSKHKHEPLRSERIQTTTQQPSSQAVSTLQFLCSELSQNLECAQSHCIQVIAAKQNEVFQLSQKHKIPSNFRNETLGLWYDAKAMIAQAFEDVKEKIFFQQQEAESQLGQRVGTVSQKPISSKLSQELANFDQFTTKSLHKIEDLQLSFEQIEVALRNDKAKIKQMITDISRQNNSKTLSAQKTQPPNDRLMSPFQRKLGQSDTNSLSVLSGKQRPASSSKTSASKNLRLKPSYDRPPTTTNTQTISTSDIGTVDRLQRLFDQVQVAEEQQSSISNDLFRIVSSLLQQNGVYISRLKPLAQSSSAEAQAKLTQANAQLTDELRQANDNYLDLKVENTKLREQMSSSRNTANYHQLCEDLVSLTTHFLNSMKQLQKALSSNAANLPALKAQFEQTKAQLKEQVQVAKQSLTSQLSVQKMAPLRTEPLRLQPPGSSERKPTVSSSQLQKLPLLLQNVKNLQQEKLKLQELITELKESHRDELSTLEVKQKKQNEQLQKYQQSHQQALFKLKCQDQLLNDLRSQLPSSQAQELAKLEHKYCQQQQLQKTPKCQDPQLQQLHWELTSQILRQQSQNIQTFKELQQSLQTKDSQLLRLKKLFVQKLHELESSVVQITTTVEETEQQQQQYQHTVEQVLAKFEEEERAKEVHNLIEANKALSDKLSSQKVVAAEQQQPVQIELLAELQERIMQLTQQLTTSQQQLKHLEQHNSELKKESSNLKYENKQFSFDLKQSAAKLAKQQSDYQTQFSALKKSIVLSKQQIEQSQQDKANLEQALKAVKELQQAQAEQLQQTQQQLEACQAELTQQQSQFQQEIDEVAREFDCQQEQFAEQQTELLQQKDHQHQQAIAELQQQHRIALEVLEEERGADTCAQQLKSQLALLESAHKQTLESESLLSQELESLRQQNTQLHNTLSEQTTLASQQLAHCESKRSLEKRLLIALHKHSDRRHTAKLQQLQSDSRQQLQSLTAQLEQDAESKLLKARAEHQQELTLQTTTLQLQHSELVDSLKLDQQTQLSKLDTRHSEAVSVLQCKVDQLTADRQELLERVQMLESPDSNQTIKQLQNTHRAATLQYENALEQRAGAIAHLQLQLNELESKLASAQNQQSDVMSACEAKVKELEERLVREAAASTAQAERQAEKLHEAEAALKSTTDAHNALLADKVAQIESLQQQLVDAQQTEQALHQTILKANESFGEQQQELIKAIQEKHAQIEQLHNKLEQAQKDCEKFKCDSDESNQKFERELKRVMAELDVANSEVSNANSNLERSNATIRQHQEQHAQLNTQLHQLQTKLFQTQELLSKQPQHEDFGELEKYKKQAVELALQLKSKSTDLDQQVQQSEQRIKKLNKDSKTRQKKLQTELDVATQQLSACQQELKERKVELEKSLAQCQVAEAEKAQIEQKLCESQRLQLQTIQDELDYAKSMLAERVAQSANSENQAKKLAAELAEANEMLKEKSDQIAALTQHAQSHTISESELTSAQQAHLALEQLLKSQLSERDSEIARLNKTITDSTQEEIQTLQAKHSDQLAKLKQAHSAELRQQLTEAADQVSTLKNCLAQADERVQTLQQDFQNEIQQHEATLQQTRKTTHLIVKLQNHFSSLLQHKIHSLQQDAETLQVYVASLEEKLGNNEFRQVQLTGDLKLSKDTVDDLRRQIDEVREQLQTENGQKVKELTAQLQEAENTQEMMSNQLNAQVVQAHRELGEKESQLEQALQKCSELTERHEEVKEELAQLRAELERSEEHCQSLNIECQKLKQEQAEKAETGRNSWGSDNGGRGSWGSGGATASIEVEEQLKHIRSIMVQFLSKLPPTTKENEDMLTILFSMLNFSPDEVTQVTVARDVLKQQQAQAQVSQQAKKGIAGFFGGTKKK